MSARRQRTYDHRLVEIVQRTGDVDIATRRGVPRSTARGWMRQDRGEVVTDPMLEQTPAALHARIVRLERRIRRLGASSPSYRHVPTGRLALLAQRIGRVFASPSTWHRLVRRFGWRRPRLRLHPAKPRSGVRAEKADALWHVDTTVIRLLDGTKAFVHAVIDNFSRRILAWRVNDHFDPGVTGELLIEAGAEKLDAAPDLLVDGGVENMNRGVDGLVERGLLRRVLAMVDISFSNSLTEAWWRSLKHNWLFLHPLDTSATVRRQVAFYVEQHNYLIPHHAFRGQTPDEVYFGKGDDIPDRLAEARAKARERHMEANRARQCAVCA